MSNEKLLMVGAGGFGRMVAEQAMIEYDCAFVDDGQPVGTDICGIPVVGSLADLPELRKPLAIRFPTSFPPVPTSVHTPSWDAVVLCYKTLVSRMVHLWVTVFC